jgi:hypothetical protein
MDKQPSRIPFSLTIDVTLVVIGLDTSRCNASSHWCGISFFGRPMLAPRRPYSGNCGLDALAVLTRRSAVGAACHGN